MIDELKEREIPLLSETVGWVELDVGCGKVWRPITKEEYEQGYYLDLREGSGRAVMFENWDSWHEDRP